MNFVQRLVSRKEASNLEIHFEKMLRWLLKVSSMLERSSFGSDDCGLGSDNWRLGGNDPPLTLKKKSVSL